MSTPSRTKMDPGCIRTTITVTNCRRFEKHTKSATRYTDYMGDLRETLLH